MTIERLSFYKRSIISIVFAFFLLRLMLPQYVKYFLFPLVFVLFLIFLFEKENYKGKFNINLIFYNLYLFILLFFFYFLSFVFTSSRDLFLYKDFFNNLLVLIFAFSFFDIDKKKLHGSLSLFKTISIYTASVIVILGLLKFFFQIFNIRFTYINVPLLGYPRGASLGIDNNFYSLASILCFLFLFHYVFKKLSVWKSTGVQVLLFLFIFSAMLTTSRRGLIVSLFIISAIFMLWLLSFLKKNETLKIFRANVNFLLTILIVVFGFLFITISCKGVYKEKEKGRLSKIVVNKNEINEFISKSFSFVIPELKRQSIDSTLWGNYFDPFNPQSGWARANYELVNEIQGKDSNIVPKGALGAKISKGIDYYCKKNDAYYYSILCRKNVEGNKRYLGSVYCYVSNDFNGDDVYLSYEKEGKHIKYSHYNLLRKGHWQKLQYSVLYTNAGVTSSIYVKKRNVKDFSTLEGFVVFAYPEFKEIDFDPNLPESWNDKDFIKISNIEGSDAPYKSVGIKIDSSLCFITNDGIRYDFLLWYGDGRYVRKGNVSLDCYASPEFNGGDIFIKSYGGVIFKGKSSYDKSKLGKWQRLSVKFESDSTNEPIEIDFFLVKNNVHNLDGLKGYIILSNPSFDIEKDTNIIPIKPSLKLDKKGSNNLSINNDAVVLKPIFAKTMSNDHFIEPRIDRWRYALYVFRYDYKWWQKLIGGGFDYTKKFAKEFNSKNDYDYPHNPFLSVLLYSGIVGLIFYVWFFIKSMYLYYKYRKEYWVLGVAYVITYFFAFFSSNSPFEPGFLGVLSFLPFIIHYVYSKEQIEQCQKEH